MVFHSVYAGVLNPLRGASSLGQGYNPTDARESIRGELIDQASVPRSSLTPGPMVLLIETFCR